MNQNWISFFFQWESKNPVVSCCMIVATPLSHSLPPFFPFSLSPSLPLLNVRKLNFLVFHATQTLMTEKSEKFFFSFCKTHVFADVGSSAEGLNQIKARKMILILSNYFMVSIKLLFSLKFYSYMLTIVKQVLCDQKNMIGYKSEAN